MDQQPGAVEEQAAVPPEEPLHSTSLTSSSSDVNDVDAAERAFASHKQSRDLSHLESAIALYQRAVDTAPVPTAHLLGRLGHCLYLYYLARGNVHNLQCAIAAKQSALQLVTEGHPDRALRLHNLSVSLRRRFESLGTVEDLKSAIEIQQDAVELTPDDDPSLPVRLDNLGSLQWLRCLRFGDLEDLERAIVSHQRATELTPEHHPDKAAWLNNLAWSLRRRFEHLHDPADLERAIPIQSRAVKLTPDAHPDLPGCLNNLGGLIWLRFRRFGELEDLESAIASQQRATELTPDNHPDKANWLHNLAWSLRSRFERLDDPADLERAITIQRRVVELTPNNHPDLSVRLDNFGSLQLLSFRRFGKLEDLERAIASQQRATELTADDHPDRATRLHNLASSMRSRFERLGDSADLERAITIQHSAVELTPDDHPDLPGRLDNLGVLQWLSFRRFRKLEDFESAIVDHRRAVSLAVVNQPDKAVWLHNLGLILADDFRRERTMERFTDALSYLMAASSQSLASPANRLQIATNAIMFLDESPELRTAGMLLSAHSRVVDVLSELVWLGHNMKRRLEESQKLGQLVSSAVCVAIGVNALEQAMEWLDAGRGLIWTQTMSLRSPLYELEQVRPDLARALEDVQVQLRNSINASSGSDATELMNVAPVTGQDNYSSDYLRGLAIKHGNLLAEVRRLPDFENFLLPKKLSALLPSSSPLSGTMVFINVDHTRCDALILSPDGRIAVVTLPQLSLDKTETLRAQWTAYLKQEKVRERASSQRYRPRSGGAVSPYGILDRLWRWIVGPILKALHIDIVDADTDRLPHITWCPTGPLTQLPLHAAGLYNEDSGPRLYRFVVSSYTPSLSAMTRSIDASTQQHTAPGILVVTQPATPGLSRLPGTTIEGTRLREVFAASQTPSMALNGNEATTDAVKLALKEHSWLHLACHGRQEVTDPLKSAFALYDGPLSLSDLMVITADNAELAFLSACQTAVGDERIPEESMHLAAGMLAVGYKGVIATMWSIMDEDAPLIVEAYYKTLLELRATGTLGAGETGAAYALHEAAQRLREKVGEKDVVRWAPFVHFGI
ncbi:unnamed protein product [Peniophora sp. CBMAI 1063]|nr:unnamed protein product [Peniophora sp. CBMAI 1063]